MNKYKIIRGMHEGLEGVEIGSKKSTKDGSQRIRLKLQDGSCLWFDLSELEAVMG